MALKQMFILSSSMFGESLANRVDWAIDLVFRGVVEGLPHMITTGLW